jgi:hypothetical protein
MMNARLARASVSSTVALWALLSCACHESGSGTAKAVATTAPAPAGPKAPFIPLDACSLVTKPEVEALVGQPAMEPRKEQVANLVTCAFGDPESPKVGERPLTQVVTLTAFTGEEGAYHAGAVAQARDSYEMARKNAASSEDVAGLGESAYWDETFKTLSVRKGKYWITVKAEGGLEAAKKVMGKAVERLP